MCRLGCPHPLGQVSFSACSMVLLSLCLVSLARPQFATTVEDASFAPRFRCCKRWRHRPRSASRSSAWALIVQQPGKDKRDSPLRAATPSVQVHLGIQIPGACGDFGLQTFSVLMGRFLANLFGGGRARSLSRFKFLKFFSTSYERSCAFGCAIFFLTCVRRVL